MQGAHEGLQPRLYIMIGLFALPALGAAACGGELTFAFKPNPPSPAAVTNGATPGNGDEADAEPALPFRDPGTPVVPPVSAGAPTLSVDPATGPVAAATEPPPTEAAAGDDPAPDGEPTDPSATDTNDPPPPGSNGPPPPTGGKPPPIADLDPDVPIVSDDLPADADLADIDLADQGPITVPIQPKQGIVKFGEYPARWLTLYDLTGHALQAATGYAPAAWKFSKTVQLDGGVALNIEYQAIGQASGQQPGGTVHVHQQVVQYLADDGVTFADDHQTYTFGNFAYQHPCMGPLRINGVVTCGGAVTLTAATQQWAGAYDCQTGFGGVTVTAVGTPHTISFQVEKAIDGKTATPQAFDFSGTYSDNGVAYPFSKGVPAAVEWCAAK